MFLCYIFRKMILPVQKWPSNSLTNNSFENTLFLSSYFDMKLVLGHKLSESSSNFKFPFQHFRCHAPKISKNGYFQTFLIILAIWSSSNHRHVVYCWKENLMENQNMLIRMYQIEISRNDKLLKRSNWVGPELLTLSYHAVAQFRSDTSKVILPYCSRRKLLS